MKRPSLPALLCGIALTAPLAAQAAMDSTTHDTFTAECVKAAKEQKLSEASAKAHCECGAKQVDGNFTDQEIKALNNPAAAPDPKLTAKLQNLVAQHCVAQKN